MTGPGPQMGWPDRAATDESVQFEVVTFSGRASNVEVVPREDQVEVWHHHEVAGVYVRQELGAWLDAPGRPIAAGNVIFSIDRMVDADGRVAISLPDVAAWTLAPTVLGEVRRRL